MIQDWLDVFFPVLLVTTALTASFGVVVAGFLFFGPWAFLAAPLVIAAGLATLSITT